MSRKLRKGIYTLKQLISTDTQLFARLSLILVIFLILSGITVYKWLNLSFSIHPVLKINSQSVLSAEDTLLEESELPFPDSEEIEIAEQTKVEQEKIRAEQERLARERQAKIDKLAGYLYKQKSPMAGYAHVIIEETERCGANYRLIVAIAGNESGYGRVPYKTYNPFGYLNKVQYSGWEASLRDLTCKVAKYTNAYGGNLLTLGKVYGAINYEQWAKNIAWHMSQIP